MKKLLLILLLTLSFQVFTAQNTNYYEIDFTLSEFCDDDPKVQYRNNYSQIFLPNQEKGISATSICVFKDGYGQYSSKGDYLDGKKVGRHIAWWRNGQKSFEANFIDGKPEGKWLNWYENGKKRFEYNHKDGKTEGKSFAWGLKGEILKEHFYENGLKEGRAFLRSPGSTVEGNYKAGMPDGNWTWFAGGSIWKEAIFSKGKLLGECNILLTEDRSDNVSLLTFSIFKNDSSGCDIESIKVNTPFRTNDGRWL
ncbi:toxin-antitoxin system YwqK family antitoxin [Candidatus Thioglobus sp. NP1]|uniref:toxin-antitoxin system YwqK family antitoxin n=1 Tax=Candidatus Thioglobus sp. NP1 TaxID=2508687 RepID=UPI0011BF21F8|nr:hypothetical protein [Candidatus Thioglobus sp. NP1]